MSYMNDQRPIASFYLAALNHDLAKIALSLEHDHSCVQWSFCSQMKSPSHAMQDQPCADFLNVQLGLVLMLETNNSASHRNSTIPGNQPLSALTLKSCEKSIACTGMPPLNVKTGRCTIPYNLRKAAFNSPSTAATALPDTLRGSQEASHTLLLDPSDALHRCLPIGGSIDSAQSPEHTIRVLPRAHTTHTLTGPDQGPRAGVGIRVCRDGCPISVSSSPFVLRQCASAGNPVQLKVLQPAVLESHMDGL
eukprot:1161337-Pelagomonas_calceolata.AAC.3